MAANLPSSSGEDDEDDDAHDADGRVLAAQVGSRTFLDGLRNFLHARGAGVGGHDPRCGNDAIQHGNQAAADDAPKNGGHCFLTYCFFSAFSASRPEAWNSPRGEARGK